MYHYLIQNGSKLFDALTEINNKIKASREANRKLVEELGGIDFRTRHSNGLFSIAAIEFKEPPDKAFWTSVGSKYESLYMPKVKNKEVLKKISDIVLVQREEINEHIKYKSQIIMAGLGFTDVRMPNISFGAEYILFEIPDGCVYEPVEGAEEILGTVYKQLKDKLNVEEA